MQHDTTRYNMPFHHNRSTDTQLCCEMAHDIHCHPSYLLFYSLVCVFLVIHQLTRTSQYFSSDGADAAEVVVVVGSVFVVVVVGATVDVGSRFTDDMMMNGKREEERNE